MLIFTGMDNSGKTTLAEKVSKEKGLPLVKSMGPDHTKDEKHIWFLDQMAREKAYPGSVIFDRFLPFEEMVYGKVLRGDPIYSLDDPYMKSLRDLNPTIIYTRPSSETIFNWDGRDQMPGVIIQKEELLRAWDDLMWKLLALGWDVRVYDYQVPKGMGDGRPLSSLKEALSKLFPPKPPVGTPMEWKSHPNCKCTIETDEEDED